MIYTTAAALLLRTDLTRHLRYDNHDRADTGRRSRRRTPAQLLGTAKLWPQTPAK